MKYFIIPIIILIVITTIAFLFRRKHIQEIARLEHDKLQIQHKPIFEEMTKIKQLNMTGETEENFERWRNEWTEVVDVHIQKIDSLLFDTEDYVDRFRFKKATATEKQIQEILHVCEKTMNSILKQLDELIGSEEKNRIEMEKLKEQHRLARKTVLAHQHAFGNAANNLDKELESFNPKFEEYEQLTTNGNYLLAREIVISLSSKGEHLFTIIHDIPSLLTELQTKIPSALRELRNGIGEMEEQSYFLGHLELTKQFNELEEERLALLQKIEQLEISSVQQRVQEINDLIESFYEVLENEVKAKHFVDEHMESTDEVLQKTLTDTRAIAEEAIFVQQSYRLDEKEANIPQALLKKLEALDKRFDFLKDKLNEQQSAFSIIREELELISTEVEDIEEEQRAFAERIENLRVDENKVRTELDELTRKLQVAERNLHKGNIPGIPDEVEMHIEEADEQIFIVSQSLQEVPLNMSAAETFLRNAERAVNDVCERIEELLENVMLIEQIIQYGNRYRVSNPEIHQRLLEAENSFRQFRYSKALEESATAVEEVEPGAMKKIEELLQKQG